MTVHELQEYIHTYIIMVSDTPHVIMVICTADTIAVTVADLSFGQILQTASQMTLPQGPGPHSALRLAAVPPLTVGYL